MTRAQGEFRRLSAGAWRELGADVRRAGRSAGRAGSACAKKHPLVLLGSGALLAAIAVSRLARPAPRIVEVPREPRPRLRVMSTLFRMGGAWLLHELSSAATRSLEARPRGRATGRRPPPATRK